MNTILTDEGINAQAQSQQSQHQLPDATVLPSPTTPTTTTTPSNENNIVGESSEQYRVVEEELQNVKESESRYKQQHIEAQKREKMLIRRLAAKEQEMQEYINQNAELKASQAPTMASLRSVLLDPAVNILFQKLKAELQATKARLEDTQNELSAWKFTPDSNTGKRLMAKCRLLYQENEELGKMTSNGRLAKLEGDLALQKSFSEEVKKSQSELDDFLQELDEDVEGMQSTILFLQQELKLAKETITNLERENFLLKNGNGGSASGNNCACSNNGHDCKEEVRSNTSDLDNSENYSNGTRNIDDVTDSNMPEQRILRHSSRSIKSGNGNGGGGDNSSNETSDDDDEEDLTSSSDDENEVYSKNSKNNNGTDIKRASSNQKRTSTTLKSSMEHSSSKKTRRSSALSIDLNVADTIADAH
ncbi:pre-mRNA-splicing regulator female-lethal(2)D [Sitodiplosis mosellana]|uniref:pre-mRNA-splicing regulator female-lethal(2)D n=1 Tax=Sitodiplosis mosellana TaxID=263140 RepID=UPI002443A85E|nr:pre-mRNA-splicing regulator female-lethal(2)D [Sitodiplosis mosellana]